MSNTDKFLSLRRLLLGKPCLCSSDNLEISDALTFCSPTANPYSCSHCCLIPSAASTHIDPIRCFPNSSVGSLICIRLSGTVKFFKVSVFFTSKSWYNRGRVNTVIKVGQCSKFREKQLTFHVYQARINQLIRSMGFVENHSKYGVSFN